MYHRKDYRDYVKCFVCGYEGESETFCCKEGNKKGNTAWMSRCRAIVFQKGNVYISGVGKVRENHTDIQPLITLPRDKNEKYVRTYRTDKSSWTFRLDKWSDPTSDDGSAAYLFHENCWTILEKASGDIVNANLMGIVDFMTIFEHLRDEDICPQTSSHDPISPNIKAMVLRTAQMPDATTEEMYSINSKLVTGEWPSTERSDLFRPNKLPLEIVCNILDYMENEDLPNYIAASGGRRLPYFFWKSKFPFDIFFDVPSYLEKCETVNWEAMWYEHHRRLMQIRTGHARRSRQLENRVRILDRMNDFRRYYRRLTQGRNRILTTKIAYVTSSDSDYDTDYDTD